MVASYVKRLLYGPKLQPKLTLMANATSDKLAIVLDSGVTPRVATWFRGVVATPGQASRRALATTNALKT